MCGKFVSLTWDEVLEVVRSIELDTSFNYDPDYPAQPMTAYPKSMVPIIAPDEGGLSPIELRWGFTAPWDDQKVLFNTRIETALSRESGIWRQAIENGRCIVPTFGFFETSADETFVSPKSGRTIKKQYEFMLPDKLTCLAGIRNQNAFSVVTTSPNKYVSPVHKRMPVVLREHEIKQWLSGDYAALADRNDVDLAINPAQL